MIAEFTFPAWMIWTAVIVAVWAMSVLATGWRREWASRPEIDAHITIQPLSVDSASSWTGAKGSGSNPSKMAPPPGPIAPAHNGPEAEHRAAYRRVGNAVQVLVADAEGHHRPLNAWVIDRSRKGLRLAAEAELPVGAAYTVRPAQAPPATPWSDVEVCHCVQTDGYWEVGCRFLQPPPVQVLMLFG